MDIKVKWAEKKEKPKVKFVIYNPHKEYTAKKSVEPDKIQLAINADGLNNDGRAWIITLNGKTEPFETQHLEEYLQIDEEVSIILTNK